MRFFIKLVSVVILCAGVSVVRAVPVTWQLQDVVFSDGSAATGSFVFDADRGSVGEYLAVNIEVFGSHPASYDLLDLASNGSGLVGSPSASRLPLIDSYVLNDNAGKSVLSLAFYNFNGGTFSPLNNAGGRRELVNLNPINLSFLGTCISSDCGSGMAYAATRTGFVQSVPEASSTSMLLLGIASISAVSMGSRRRVHRS